MAGPNSQGTFERGATVDNHQRKITSVYWPSVEVLPNLKNSSALPVFFDRSVFFCSVVYSYVITICMCDVICSYYRNVCTHCHSELLSICLAHCLIVCLAMSSYSINTIWVNEWTNERNVIGIHKKPLILKNSTCLHLLCVSFNTTWYICHWEWMCVCVCIY